MLKRPTRCMHFMPWRSLGLAHLFWACGVTVGWRHGPSLVRFSGQLRERSEIAGLRVTIVERHYLQSSLLQHVHVPTVFTGDR
jgi:hypothetical protein